MRIQIIMAAIVAGLSLVAPAQAASEAAAAKLLKSTADHSKFKPLQQVFNSGPEVTKACLSCHTEAGKQLMKTEHWTWEYKSPEGQLLGKRHDPNVYCGSIISNYGR